ncbi:hypothetical protein LCGC14_0993440, partial [marine sediment metagenome]
MGDSSTWEVGYLGAFTFLYDPAETYEDEALPVNRKGLRVKSAYIEDMEISGDVILNSLTVNGLSIFNDDVTINANLIVTGTITGGGGGPGIDTSAVHVDVAAEISAIAVKGTPVAGDYIIIEDSADSDNKKHITIGNLPGIGGADLDAIHDNVAAEISAIAAKGTPVGADYLLIEDSAAADFKKRSNKPIITLQVTGGNQRQRQVKD